MADMSVFLLTYQRSRGITLTVERNKKARTTDKVTIAFPPGSPWQAVYREIRIIALRRETSVGQVIFDALQSYVEREGEAKKKPSSTVRTM